MIQEAELMEDRLWKKSGWTCRIIKNDGDDGWAAAMTRVGDDEPALVTPWTMGRDKKNPKPMDQSGFMTLVKTASEVLLRHEQQARARLHKRLHYRSDDGVSMRADLDIVADDQDPHAILTVRVDASSELVREERVEMSFKLTAANVSKLGAQA